MNGLFHLHRLNLRRLYPFDSLRSLRVTVVGRVFSIKVPSRKAVTLSGGWRFTDTRSRMGITMVRTNTDDFICMDLTFLSYTRSTHFVRSG